MADFDKEMQVFNQLRTDFYRLREEFRKSIQEFKKLNRDSSLVNETDIDGKEWTPDDQGSTSGNKTA